MLSNVPGASFGLASGLVLLLVAFDLRTPLPRPQETGLTVSRCVSETKTLMGVPVLIELTLENHGCRIEKILMHDTPPVLATARRLHGRPSAHAVVTKGSTSLLCGIGKGGRVTLRYEIEFREPGEYRFGSCSIRLQSMFGLAERALVLPSPLTVRVYPRRLAKRVDTGPARAFGWSGVTPSKYSGGRLDFVNVRSYVSGDPLRDVNWKASGRLGKMLVNEWRAERGLDCVVIVDLSAGSLPNAGEWTGRGDVITSAYELMCSLVGSGNRVGLLVMGSSLGKIKPRLGSKQLKAMVETLVDSGEGEVWSTKHAAQFLELFFRRQYTLRRGTLFFVFAWPSVELLESVSSLSRMGFVCNSVIVDALGGEGRALTEQRILRPEEVEFGLRFARAELGSFKAMLTAFSDVYVWTAGSGFTEEGRKTRR
ncbi:MAG: DUF58 domain-containing protein [Nitrososphaerales archaeon]|jgi:uncharacterized protein (DUF58 family)